MRRGPMTEKKKETPFEPNSVAEFKRSQAVKLHLKGKKPAEIAEAVDAGESSVYRWIAEYRKSGWNGLKTGIYTGRNPKLKPVQVKRLIEALENGPRLYGFEGDRWTLDRIKLLIKKLFGVDLHKTNVWELLKKQGWSYQKPVKRSAERNEEAIADWKNEKWPELKKGPSETGSA